MTVRARGQNSRRLIIPLRKIERCSFVAASRAKRAHSATGRIAGSDPSDAFSPKRLETLASHTPLMVNSTLGRERSVKLNTVISSQASDPETNQGKHANPAGDL